MNKSVLGILISGREMPDTTQRLITLAKESFMEVLILNITSEVSQEDLEKMIVCDIIFNDSGEDYAINYIKIFENIGIPVVESSKALIQENKWNFYKICVKNNIPAPKSILLDTDLEVAKKQLEEFNCWPVILKRVVGTWGDYVQKAENVDEAIEVMKKFWEKGNQVMSIIAQEFVDSFSYRVTYIDDEIVQTAIKENNNWKCTGVYAQNFKKFDIDDNLKQVINKIMSSFDIKICGVDLLKRGDEWVVIEVNTEPALDFFQDETDFLLKKEIALIQKVMTKAYENISDDVIVASEFVK